MEKFPNSCDKEYMKMAMLKHEEMFREQVYELHRLYQVQKMLMNSISRNNQNEQNQDRLSKSKDENNTSNVYNSQDIHQTPRQKLDLEEPAAEEHRAKLDGNGVLDECEIELTLGPSSFYPTTKTKTQLTSDSGHSFSFSSTGSSCVKGREHYSNGTRRINDKFTKEKQVVHNWGLVEVPNSSSSFLNDRRNVVTNDNNEQDRLHPPWLFQVLSMNIT